LVQAAKLMELVSISNVEHYHWGADSEGWHLLKRDDISIIQERVPAGGKEVLHYHERSRQFFYILEGEGRIVFEDRTITLKKGDGLEIPLLIKHRFENHSAAEVIFLVVSAPKSHGDRVNVE
jgi:mannose-6-phosphate isomerase-like protein (cupin superfamily)